jgi:hypothetical protein
MPKKEELPRFEIVKVGLHYCAYDYLTRDVRWPQDRRSYPQAEGLVALLSAEARKKGEPLSVLRVWSSPPKKPGEKKNDAATRH